MLNQVLNTQAERVIFIQKKKKTAKITLQSRPKNLVTFVRERSICQISKQILKLT